MSTRVVSICGLRDWEEGRRDDGVASGRSFYPTSLVGIHCPRDENCTVIGRGAWRVMHCSAFVQLQSAVGKVGESSGRKVKVRGICIWQAAKPLWASTNQSGTKMPVKVCFVMTPGINAGEQEFHMIATQLKKHGPYYRYHVFRLIILTTKP